MTDRELWLSVFLKMLELSNNDLGLSRSTADYAVDKAPKDTKNDR